MVPTLHTRGLSLANQIERVEGRGPEDTDTPMAHRIELRDPY